MLLLCVRPHQMIKNTRNLGKPVHVNSWDLKRRGLKDARNVEKREERHPILKKEK